ncbi:TIGR03745 family integrating conjugative element membrane protein [Escherichia coli]|uniref:TIGR03745 family integrating conjugative element membrane protein n=1 Tax=Escherichia coli TaxID=562 RepID=UPI001123802F|nr:TIGR03745 family integrating conjugative element membrane protein [Escherichia coli]TNT81109.1 TIGR03745 family integrating conjugative element membrane protein [Escherichia coli]
MKWCFRFLKRLVSLPHTMLLRLWQAVFSLCLLLWMSMQPALADLPTMEPPSSGGGSGLFGQIKGYSQDGVVLGGLIIAAIGFIVVANAAISTFAEVQDGKKGWSQFGAIVVVGVILLVAVIWLLTKSASIIL